MELRKTLFGFAIALLPALSSAGSLSLGPTRLELSESAKVRVVTVRNTGAETTLVQMDTMVWTRDESGDRTEETTRLVASPAVFELKPGQERQVRVGLRQGESLSREQSYRLYVRELRPTAASVEATLQFALRIGIPVYVGGASSPLKPAQSASARE